MCVVFKITLHTLKSWKIFFFFFLIVLRETTLPLSHPLQPLSLICDNYYVCSPSLYFSHFGNGIWVESYTVWLWGLAFFIQLSFLVINTSVMFINSLSLWLNSFPCYGCTTGGVTIHPFKEICVVFQSSL